MSNLNLIEASTIIIEFSFKGSPGEIIFKLFIYSECHPIGIQFIYLNQMNNVAE